MNRLIECNFDGIVGPTHHFGGLGVGNLASQSHAGQGSRPRAAALQGLDKIESVTRLIDSQKMRCAVLPPQMRPDLEWLRRIGFRGSPQQLLSEAHEQAPQLLSAAFSASAMWTANAATVAPACDTADRRTHLTISNLSSSVHRSLEPAATFSILNKIFPAAQHFTVHPALPGGFAFRDEGAANHMRLSDPQGREGFHLFVFGALHRGEHLWPRQGREASAAIARLHGLSPGRVFLIEQNPAAIDAGAFHNDVVATSHNDLLLHHELAFAPADPELEPLRAAFQKQLGIPLRIEAVSEDDLPLREAVASYLFNSQIVPTPGGQCALVCPQQCFESAAAQRVIRAWLDRGLFAEVCYVELRESMSNGGGPACLRLRVPVLENQLPGVAPAVFWSDQLAEALRELISQRYPETLTTSDLMDPAFAEEALETVRRIRGLLQLTP